MFEYLPLVCKELHGNIREIYWIMLVPFTVLTLVLELFRMPEQNPDGGHILKRVAVSVILLLTFEPCLNAVAAVGDGIAEKIQGDNSLPRLLRHLENSYADAEVNWLKFKEAVVFVFGVASYIVAYVGVFMATVLINFSWAILYVCSPLMILMHVSVKTSFVTANLYKGLINVMIWKILAAILGTLLLKMIVVPEVGDWGNFLMSLTMNLCIGFSMLFIPLASKSLVGDGMTSLTSGLAAVPSALVGGVVKKFVKTNGGRMMRGTGRMIARPFKKPESRSLSHEPQNRTKRKKPANKGVRPKEK